MSQRIILGDCLARMRELPAGHFHCVVTSPPYLGLRQYAGTDDDAAGIGNEPRDDCWAWAARLAGFDAESCGVCFVCRLVAVMREVRRVLRDDGVAFVNLGDGYASSGTMATAEERNATRSAKLTGGMTPPGGRASTPAHTKPKNLLLLPHRVALALQADGWYVRGAIVWAKGASFCDTWHGSVMPESCRDRPTRAHESVFMLTKRPRYFSDMEAVKEGAADPNREAQPTWRREQPESPYTEQGSGEWGTKGGRNLRDVWAVPVAGYGDAMCRQCRTYYRASRLRQLPKAPGPHGREVRVCECGAVGDWLSHYATFPVALAEACLRIGTSERGCCPTCGAAWRRVVERKAYGDWRPKGLLDDVQRGSRGGKAMDGEPWVPPRTVGFEPGCACATPQQRACGADANGHYHGTSAGDPDACRAQDPSATKARILAGMGAERIATWQAGCDCDAPTVPCRVLDPFAGAGTTLVAAANHGLDAVGIELSPDYAELAEKRLADREAANEETRQEAEAARLAAEERAHTEARRLLAIEALGQLALFRKEDA